MAFTTSDLDSINAAIASGELTVSVQGRSVTYRSLSDLLKAKSAIESDLAAQRTGGRVRTGYFTFATSRERY
jgi:hypothetical protein